MTRKACTAIAAVIGLSLSSAYAQVLEGGGPLPGLPPGQCLTGEARARIQARLSRNLEALQGVLPKERGGHPLFQWPLRTVPTFADFGYHGVSNYVDQNESFPNQLRDFQCGARTYDLSSGYNHSGTDFFISPFPWRKMDRGEVQIVAAAAGTILDKDDGFFDRNCSFTDDTPNAVYLRHADGSITWYLHMRRNSVTTKAIGASIAAGEVLGLVGSSGFSTGPHLHFEVHGTQNRLIDPYDGPCNDLNPNTWWQEQPPYYNSAINKLATHSTPPSFAPCPQPESENLQDRFDPGNRVYVAAYYRDQLSTQQTQYSVYRPDGSLFARWNHSSPQTHYAASYWYWYVDLPQNAPLGTWKFESLFEGGTYAHGFRVGPDVLETAIPWSLLLAGLAVVSRRVRNLKSA